MLSSPLPMKPSAAAINLFAIITLPIERPESHPRQWLAYASRSDFIIILNFTRSKHRSAGGKSLSCAFIAELRCGVQFFKAATAV